MRAGFATAAALLNGRSCSRPDTSLAGLVDRARGKGNLLQGGAAGETGPWDQRTVGSDGLVELVQDRSGVDQHCAVIEH